MSKKKSRPEEGRNKWSCVGEEVPGGSMTCWFTQDIRNSIVPLFRPFRDERAKDQMDLAARNSSSIEGLL